MGEYVGERIQIVLSTEDHACLLALYGRLKASHQISQRLTFNQWLVSLVLAGKNAMYG